MSLAPMIGVSGILLDKKPLVGRKNNEYTVY